MRELGNVGPVDAVTGCHTLRTMTRSGLSDLRRDRAKLQSHRPKEADA